MNNKILERIEDLKQFSSKSVLADQLLSAATMINLLIRHAELSPAQLEQLRSVRELCIEGYEGKRSGHLALQLGEGLLKRLGP